MPFATLLLAAATLESTVLPPEPERAAIFTAAGFVRRGSEWRTRECEGLEGNSYSPGNIDSYGDVNDDGRLDAVVSESGAICYGMAGTRFWLLSRQPTGAWKLLASEIGMPQFLATEGAEGWPDLEIGGPGFCFPVRRWNGRSYDHHRFEYEGRPCNPQE